MRAFCLFAALQFLNYFNLTVNYRAVAHQQYVWAAISDAVACVLGWTLIKQIASAESWPARVGYVVGGTTASAAGIWITKAWG